METLAEILVDFALAEKEEEDSIGGGDFVIVGVISGAIVGALVLMRSGDCIINSLIPRLVCVSLASRACSIIAILSFDLSIASCHINENSDSVEKTDLAGKRERRRLAEDEESFFFIAMFTCLITGYLYRDINGLLSYLIDESNPA